jgi:hypothetical protein
MHVPSYEVVRFARGREPQGRGRCTVCEMSRSGPALALLAVAAAALAAALPAAGKEGVKATLTTNIPLDAPAGTQVKVAWSLAGVDENGRRYPFGANGVFVRLVSASGAAATTGFAPSGTYTTGEYAATVVVPEGGIGDVRIGLRGFSSGATGYRESAMLFPITNDPLPGAARVTSPPDSGSSKKWVAFPVAAALCAVAVLGFVLARRRNARGEATIPSPS